MLLGVYAWRSCAFTSRQPREATIPSLNPRGTPRRDTLSAGAIRRYRFLPLVARDVVLTLTLLAGAPPFLFASTDADAIINTDCVQHNCRDNRAEFVKMPDDPRPLHISSREVRAGEPLYIGVSATDNSSFTIVATAPLPLDQREEGGSSVLQLLPGVPQHATIPKGVPAFFTLVVPPAGTDGSHDVVIELTPDVDGADPDLYASLAPAGAHTPTNPAAVAASFPRWDASGDHGGIAPTWFSEDPGDVAVIRRRPRGCSARSKAEKKEAERQQEDEPFEYIPCELRLTVVSWSDGDTAFTIRASVRGAAEAAVLQEGVAVSGAVDEARWEYFQIEMPSLHRPLTITLTSLSGDADLYAAVGHRPTRSNWQWGSDHAPEDSPIFHMLDLAGGDIDALGDLGKDALRDMIRDADGSSDVLQIRPGDPHFPTEAPATIEVGVYGAEGRSEYATCLVWRGSAAAVERSWDSSTRRVRSVLVRSGGGARCRRHVHSDAAQRLLFCTWR